MQNIAIKPTPSINVVEMDQLKLDIIREFSENMGVPTCCTHALKHALKTENLDIVRKNLKNWAAKHKHDENAVNLVSLLREQKFDQLADYLDEYLKDNRLCEPESRILLEPLLCTTETDVKPSINHLNELNPEQLVTFENDDFAPDKQKIVPRFIRRKFSKRFRFVSSLIFMIIGIASFASAGVFYSYSYPVANQIGQIEMNSLNHSTETSQTILTTENSSPILKDKITSCFGGHSSQTPPSFEEIMSILPDWRETVDLCHSAPVELIIYDDTGIFSDRRNIPKVLCPQNVVALEIFSSLTEFQLKNLLSTFCSVSNITFNGNDNCDMVHNKKIRKFLSPNVISLAFEDIFSCGRLFEKFTDQFYFPNLKILSFSCVNFLTAEFDNIDKIISSSKIFEEIYCSDGDMCKDLISNLTSSVRMTTRKINCGLGS